jgi:hypothetical protein
MRLLHEIIELSAGIRQLPLPQLCWQLVMTEELVVAPKQSPLRRRGIEAAVGTLAGLVLACVSGPAFVSTWYKPLSDAATNQCGTDVKSALSDFVKLQLITGLIGGVILLLGSFLFRRMLRKRREARAVPSA